LVSSEFCGWFRESFKNRTITCGLHAAVHSLGGPDGGIIRSEIRLVQLPIEGNLDLAVLLW
jgi:hypothetical protein